MKILNVVGTRPNFIKMAPLVDQLAARGHESILVHTGQHYDDNMSRIFFEELGLPEPDIHLGVGSASQAVQTAKIMIEFEQCCLAERPGLVIVVGDVNSTLACAVVSAKLCIPVAHVEAGLRSFDRGMPEEVNRVVTDRLSDLLFTPSLDADENLLREGVPTERIHRVGNIMIDSLRARLDQASRSQILEQFALRPREYGVLTLHRPSNVDDPKTLTGLMRAVENISRRLPIIFSCHPRTAQQLERSACRSTADLRVVPPLGYTDFLRLYSESKLVLTDWGGLQVETTVLGVPCLTIRENTERPITITEGTNWLVGTDPNKIEAAAAAILDGRQMDGHIPDLWDGQTAGRIVDVIENWQAERPGTS
jgi:UDP-N-acetylglucosamine 2-epimerase (non-hydrolysing)